MKDARLQSYRDRIVEEAADWFARLQDAEALPEDRAAFADWLSASAEHVREYLALAALHADISELKSSHTAGDLIHLAGASQPVNVVELKAPASGILSRRVENVEVNNPDNPGAGALKKYVALAASLALIALAGTWWVRNDPNSALYTTSIGEQKSFTLSDGSVITLNAVSKIRLDYTEQHRDIQLLSGEALFNVAKDVNKPFRVMTGGSVIQAVGTRFNVRHRQQDTTVTVLEGRVKVSSSSLPVSKLPEGSVNQWVPVAAGQRAQVDAPGAIAVSAVDTAVNTAWRERRLIFESRPLKDVVTEFNLYNESPIEIRDPRLNDIQVSGSFYANDPQSFALFLEEAKLASAQIRSGEIRLVMPPSR